MHIRNSFQHEIRRKVWISNDVLHSTSQNRMPTCQVFVPEVVHHVRSRSFPVFCHLQNSRYIEGCNDGGLYLRDAGYSLLPNCSCLFCSRYPTKNQPCLRLEKLQSLCLVIMIHLICGRTAFYPSHRTCFSLFSHEPLCITVVLQT